MADFLTFKKAGLCCHVHGKMNCDKCAEQYLVEGIKVSNRRIAELEQQLAEAKSELEQLTICGWLFQHEDTRLTEIVDNWQVEKGFEWQNPRWKKIHPVYRKGGE